MKEKKDLREACVKCFENADHSVTAAVYGKPVHFMEEDQWRTIDNHLYLEKDGRYTNRKNALKVHFAKLAQGEPMVSLQRGDWNLQWKLHNALAAEIQVKNTKESDDGTVVTGLTSRAIYPGALPYADVEYVLTSDELKENIILREMPEEGSIMFEIQAEGLMTEMEGQKVLFKDASGKCAFSMAAPYMVDGADSRSYDIKVQCLKTEKEGRFIYILIPDYEWLRASERKWPVVIDPIITSPTDYRKIYDTRICSRYPNDNFVNDLKLVTGQSTSVGVGRSLINFELPTLKPADMVVAAIFNVTCLSDYRVSKQVNLHRILDNWDSTTVTWNTMPKYESRIAECNIFSDEIGKSIQFDITEMVKDWYTNGKAYGVMLKDRVESGNYNEYLSSDSGDDLAELRPKVFIKYVNYTGLQQYWTYHSQDIRRAGTVSINDYNGNLIFKHMVDAISGNRMPYELYLVYNSNDRDVDLGYGKGFRLNYHQMLLSRTIEDTQYYEWTDGTGSKHYFKWDKDKSKWLDEDNSDYELTMGSSASEKYTVKDKNNGRLIFNSSGYLCQCKDSNNNVLTISYGDNHIQSVTDGVGRKLTMAYMNGHLSSVTNPAGRFKSFVYMDGCLNGIQDFDGKEIFLTTTNGLLTSVKNYDNYQMTYSYTSNPPRVREVKEFINSAEKRKMTITYGFNMNTFTDEKGRSETYLFNHHGNTVSIKNQEGYAQTQEYMETKGAVNQLSKVSKLQYTAPQYLKNPNVFDNSAWAGSATAGATASINTDGNYAKTGNRSLKLDSTSISALVHYDQTVNLKKGRDYTFSAYLKTANEIASGPDAGAYLRVIYTNNAGQNQYLESRKVKITYGEWTYLDLQFSLPADASSDSVTVSVFWKNDKGTLYADALQLEEGQVGNRRNLIENNDFTYQLNKFTRSSTMEDRDNLVDIQTLSSGSGGGSDVNIVSGTVNADVLNVRSGPGTGYEAVTQISYGQMVTVLDSTTGSGMTWYHIRFALNGVTYTGYVAAEYVTLISSTVRTGTVNADVLNVRSGPGTGYEAVAQVLYGTGVTILSEASGSGMQWFQITYRYEGVEYTGYVAAEYITETTSSGNGSGPVDTEDISVLEGPLNTKAMRMVGDPQKEKRLSQTLSVSGKAKDVFVVNAWGCGNPMPLKDNRAFGVELAFNYTDGTKQSYVRNFQSDSNQWQYLNSVIIPEKDYNSVIASYVFNYNANAVYFDGLSVYKEEFWPSYTYDSDGKIISCTDAGNRKTTFAYDINNNIKKIVTPSGANFDYTYDDKHNITGATTAANRKYQFAYDSYGNLTSYKIVDPANENVFIKNDYVYTSDGNYQAQVKNYFGHTLTFNYDQNTGELKSVTDADGKTVSYAYDEMRRVIGVTGRNEVNGAETPVTKSYTYENDRLKTIGHHGMNYTFDYDGFGNVVQTKVGNQVISTTTYKPNSSLAEKVVFENGQGVSAVYDEYDRIIQKNELWRSGVEYPNYRYTYDNEGNLSYVEDILNSEKMHYLYNTEGRLVRVENKAGDYVLYNYDTNGKLISIREAYNDNAQETGYEYDADYNEVKTTTLGGKHVTSQYDALGLLTSQTLNTTAPFTVSYGYASGENNAKTPVIQSYNNNGRSMTYQYYPNGNIRKIQTAWTTQTYAYDAFGQLIRSDDDNTDETIIYAYDTGGNMTSKKVYYYAAEGTEPTTLKKEITYTYDSVWKDKMVQCDGKTLTYDEIGNLTAFDYAEYQWKNGRQLSGYFKSGVSASYGYNHNGQRCCKTVGSVRTDFTYVGSLLARQKSDNLDMRFTYNTLGIPVALWYNGSEYYYVRNLQNDIIGLIDSTGEWVVEYSYDAWGKILNISGSLAATVGQNNPLRYRGYYYDNETGLYYVSSRYYHPELGRFISIDSMDVLVATLMALTDKNLYAYCDNNPVMRKDVNGELWIAAVVIGLATQYAGDVVQNLFEGKRGTDIFEVRSSAGEYLAAGITALIPGSGFGGAFARNIVTEGIVSIERHIKGESNDLTKSAIKVAFGTGTDMIMENVINETTKYVSSKMPKNYSSYAGVQYKKNPSITPVQIRQSMSRSIRWGNRISKGVVIVFNLLRSVLPW